MNYPGFMQLESIAIFSTTTGSFSESPAADSSSDSYALRAYEDFPLDFSVQSLIEFKVWNKVQSLMQQIK